MQNGALLQALAAVRWLERKLFYIFVRFCLKVVNINNLERTWEPLSDH